MQDKLQTDASSLIKMKMFVILLQLFHSFLGANACTEIRLTAKDTSVIIGRTMDYTFKTLSNIITEPEGYNHIAVLPEGCPPEADRLSWSNKYSLAYEKSGGVINISADGMNSAGLSVGALMFHGFTKYKVPPSQYKRKTL